MTTKTKAVDQPKMTAAETVNSLNGFEELAIVKHFGSDYFDLPLAMRYRALTAVQMIREGSSGQAAYKAAMELKQSEAVERFADDEEDEEAEEDSLSDAPVTEAGKGDAVPA